MRVAIELTALELDSGGTARAIEQLLPRLREQQGLELVELSHPGQPSDRRWGRLTRGLDREFRYMPRTLPRLVADADVDVLHCPSPLAPPRCPVPMAITIHDVIGWDHPEWLTKANVMQLRTRLPKALKAGAHVITSSSYSRERIIEQLDLDESRVSVVVLGLDPRFNPDPDERDAQLLEALEVTRPFILTVGTLQPRKNVEAAIEAFERLDTDADDLDLVVVGARGWHEDELLARLDRSPARDRISLLGRVTDEQLIALYRAADCFVFPSRYEGFGFPPLEAMACGTPVVSSGRTSLAEIVEGVGLVIDPDDPQQIADELRRVLSDSDLRRRLVDGGVAHAADFTWERCAAETTAVYETIAR